MPDAVRAKLVRLRIAASSAPDGKQLSEAAVCIDTFPQMLRVIEALLAERDLRPAFDQLAEPELARAVEATDAALERLVSG